MTTYRIEWEIELDADSPQEAAEKALAIHRNPNSMATVFDVTEFDAPDHRDSNWRIDLSEDAGENDPRRPA